MQEGSDTATARRMIRNAGALSLLTLLSRILGLLREMTKAALLGTGGLSDAFTVAFVIPNFMRRLFAEGSVTVAFIPTFKGFLLAGDDEETREFLSASLTVLLVLLGLVVSAGIALSPLIVLAFGSDPAETAILTRIMFPFLALVSVAALFQGILNAYGVFKPSGVAPVLFNICFMGVPLLAGGSFANPARAMAVGVLLGGTAQAFCQLPAVLRTGHRFGLVPLARAFRNSGMGKVLGLIAPTVVGMAAYQINDIVSTILASRAGTGIAASLQYSLRLQELMLGIFAVSASTVLLPELADASRQEDWARFLSRLRTGMEGIILATVPVAIFSMITGREIVSLLFRMREFGDESVNLTVSVFFWHQAGLAFIALNRVVAPAFYARSDTKTPTVAGIVSFGVNMALALVLAPVLRGSGIAMALSIAGIVNTALLLQHVRSSAIPGSVRMLRAFAGTACRVLLVSAGAGLPLLVMRPAILELGAGSGSRWISAGMPLAIQSILYGCMVVAIAHVSGVASIGRVLALFRRR